MSRPRRMKSLEMHILDRDVDAALERLGRLALLQPALEADPDGGGGVPASAGAAVLALGRVRELGAYLGVPLPEECDPDSRLADAADAALLEDIAARTEVLRVEEQALESLRGRSAEALDEARKFAALGAPSSRLAALSFMTFRIGRVEEGGLRSLADGMGERGLVIPLGGEGRVLALASRSGRFALDAELAKADFKPIPLPEDFAGVSGELLDALASRGASAEAGLSELARRKAELAVSCASDLRRLSGNFSVSAEVARLRARLESAGSAFLLRGWVPADKAAFLARELVDATGGRVAVLARDPLELESVRSGRESVPVSLSHGRFVRGFEPMVFSYGAPLYGNIDPTAFVAISFTLMFGLMFGDLGQGFFLFLLGVLVRRKGIAFLYRFSRFGGALKAVGCASMAMGALYGEFFAYDGLLVAPTRAITALLFGEGRDRFLSLMPEGGAVGRLYAFFGFTLAVGVVLNSVGLAINLINLASRGRWADFLFSKTGVFGALLFWWALGLGLRVLSGGAPAWWDGIGLGLPLLVLGSGHVLGRLVSGKRPLFADGVLAAAIEAVVGMLEGASYYFSNSASFLRVGAFALSHTVLAFIVFTMADLVYGASGPFGLVLGGAVVVVGNLVIIFLEGLIVAIQTVRLEYYEFFSKFFSETGAFFAPFRFRREVR